MSATMSDDGSLHLAKQIVYLDFDGEETVYKNDALGVEYSINVSDSLITEERQAEIVEKLNEQYNGNGIYFTNTVPLDFVEFSTIYVGRPDGLPEDNDIFGLSETIDVNNQNHAHLLDRGQKKARSGLRAGDYFPRANGRALAGHQGLAQRVRAMDAPQGAPRLG